MERVGRTVLAIWLAAGAVALGSCAQVSSTQPAPSAAGAGSAQTGSTAALPKLPPDATGQGRVLTDYLKAHKLPLVGANVIDGGAGRQVVLYGFVATSLGKRNAEEQVRRIVNDPRVTVVDRIIVRPELLTMDGPGTQDDSQSQLATGQSYPAPDEIKSYQQQQQSSWQSWIVPLLMIAPMFIP